MPNWHFLASIYFQGFAAKKIAHRNSDFPNFHKVAIEGLAEHVKKTSSELPAKFVGPKFQFAWSYPMETLYLVSQKSVSLQTALKTGQMALVDALSEEECEQKWNYLQLRSGQTGQFSLFVFRGSFFRVCRQAKRDF